MFFREKYKGTAEELSHFLIDSSVITVIAVSFITVSLKVTALMLQFCMMSTSEREH